MSSNGNGSTFRGGSRTTTHHARPRAPHGKPREETGHAEGRTTTAAAGNNKNGANGTTTTGTTTAVSASVLSAAEASRQRNIAMLSQIDQLVLPAQPEDEKTWARFAADLENIQVSASNVGTAVSKLQARLAEADWELDYLASAQHSHLRPLNPLHRFMSVIRVTIGLEPIGD